MADRLPSSFRDPSGFVFRRDGILLRQINEPYRKDFELLMGSGLHDALASEGLLVKSVQEPTPDGVALLRPEVVPFISYPYEWSFSQLKDAALLTLEVQRRSMEKNMSLKDASAYNVQFVDGKPILIDTLSFEEYQEGKPWVAYRQFCRHFLAPLALMALTDVRLNGLLRQDVDGVALDLTSHLLPGTTKLKPGLAVHIHLHAKSEGVSAGKSAGTEKVVTRTGLMGILDSLKGTLMGLDWSPTGTVWGDYYSDTNYTEAAMQSKRAIVSDALQSVKSPNASCWDLGANTGEFSRIAAGHGYPTIAWDMDPAAVEKGYRSVKEKGEKNLLPLLQDFANPSPSVGWGGEERGSLFQRGPADVAMALALIHHLAIGNNVPLPMIASFLARLGRYVIVEFVPKEDSQVHRLLASRKDVFDEYAMPGWENAIEPLFETLGKWPVAESKRTVYLLKARREP
ncbi:MAG TPA: hypothetical protein VG944_15865 [Fimbriimonas sp.]|nr:hypothetical protein [Fimbriimonas sp.]